MNLNKKPSNILYNRGDNINTSFNFKKLKSNTYDNNIQYNKKTINQNSNSYLINDDKSIKLNKRINYNIYIPKISNNIHNKLMNKEQIIPCINSIKPFTDPNFYSDIGHPNIRENKELWNGLYYDSILKLN